MSSKIFDNDLMFNKPAYVGFWIINLNKVLMYEFHYDYIKKRYGINSRLLFTDTDSLMYEIKTEDKHKVILILVFSNLSFQYSDDSNKLVVGKVKDEAAGVAFKEFVGLKPEMYSYLVDDSIGE